MDILLRDDAPLSDDQWAALDEAVNSTASTHLIGRRLLPVYGPLGAGIPSVPMSNLQDDELIQTGEMNMVQLHELKRDFLLKWRDLEMSGRMGMPVDYAPASAAAQAVARMEDEMIFQGCEDTNAAGLLNADGIHEIGGSDWAEAGNLFNDVVNATGVLGEAGYPGPYAVAVSPAIRAQAHRPVGRGVRLEISSIEGVAEKGVFASPALSSDQMVVMATGAQNADLAIGQDIKTAYMGNEELHHLFRVMETLALRIKRPDSIAVVSKG